STVHTLVKFDASVPGCHQRQRRRAVTTVATAAQPAISADSVTRLALGAKAKMGGSKAPMRNIAHPTIAEPVPADSRAASMVNPEEMPTARPKLVIAAISRATDSPFDRSPVSSNTRSSNELIAAALHPQKIKVEVLQWMVSRSAINIVMPKPTAPPKITK